MDYLAAGLGVRPLLVPSLRRNPGWHDVRALIELTRIIRRERPQIVHTHAAKGGTLGRVATLLAFPLKRSRPILIHTYHGHSLTGYFSPRVAAIYRRIEQVLGRVTDRLVAVSQEVCDELVGMRVARREKFEVVALGFDLAPFAVNSDVRQRTRHQVRAELGIPADARLVTLIARLVPIKRVDRFLALANRLREVPGLRFLIVGDGGLRDSLQDSPEARALEGQLVWAGFRRDMPAVLAASDVVVQTSDNEGTPVSLIEAQAAGLPVVSTDVGGTRSVVRDRETGFISPRDDLVAATDLLRSLLLDDDLRAAMGAAARHAMIESYSLDRLTADLDQLYQRELAAHH